MFPTSSILGVHCINPRQPKIYIRSLRNKMDYKRGQRSSKKELNFQNSLKIVQIAKITLALKLSKNQ